MMVWLLVVFDECVVFFGNGVVEGSIVGFCVLLVEDDQEMVLLFMVLLEFVGVMVMVVKSGVEVLERLLEMFVDVIVFDIGLFDMDGYELICYIKVDFCWVMFWIVVLMGCNCQDDVWVVVEVGFDIYLFKLLDFGMLFVVFGDMY